MHAALVKFIEDHESDAFERRILLQPARQDSFGDDLDPRALADPRLEPRAITHGFAGRFAERLCHAACDRACSEASRLEHDDLACVQPRLMQKRERDACGFTCARRCLQHDPRAFRERLLELGEGGVDGKRHPAQGAGNRE